MKSCSGGGVAQFTLMALYDYYLATVISGASFGEDLQANLKAELRQIGQTHYTHFLQEQLGTPDILEFEFPKNNLNTRYLISDLDDLFKRWSNVDHFALDTLRTSKDFDYNFSLKRFFDAYEKAYHEPIQFGYIGQSDWDDAVVRVKEELVQIGRNHFGGSAADIYNLHQSFSVKDEYFRAIIDDLIQLFSRTITPFCEPHLVHCRLRSSQQRTWCGNVSTNCLVLAFGHTSRSILSAFCNARRDPHAGQKPRPLQLNPITRSAGQCLQ